jgi:hypothetical protein
MIDIELKNLINELEDKLKKDYRFKENGDNKYRKQMKRIYQESKYNKKPIDMTSLMNLNPTAINVSPIVNLAKINNVVDSGDLAFIKHINNMLIQANEKFEMIINS